MSEFTRDQLSSLIDASLDRRRFHEQHWEGSFWDYLDIVGKNPSVCRNAYQRLYDMVMSFGAEKYRAFKKDLVRYHFFSDPIDHGADGVFGLDEQLMQLVDVFRSAAEGYGSDRRILLLHGPVGSSKSTIARLLKKGLEHYSRTDAGALYSYVWMLDAGAGPTEKTHEFPCPMHEDPLLLVPTEARVQLQTRVNESFTAKGGKGRIRLYNEVNPFCRKVLNDLMVHYGGDWKQAMPGRGERAAPVLRLLAAGEIQIQQRSQVAGAEFCAFAVRR